MTSTTRRISKTSPATPADFTKKEPQQNIVYVKIEAAIPMDNEYDFADQIENALDALRCDGTAEITAQYQVEEDFMTAARIIINRRHEGDLSGEVS